MASPNAFLSSPSRSANRKSHFFRSSSPDLPAIGDILSRGARNQPPKRDDPALVISSDEETEITRARTTQDAGFSSRSTRSMSNGFKATESDDTSLLIIDPPTVRTPEARRHHAAPPRFRSQSGSPSGSPAKDQPWKRFKSKVNGSQSDSSDSRPTEIEKAGPIPAQPVIESLRVENDINAPLRLEPAMIRRLDWTPPSHKTTTILKPSSPALGDLQSPGEPRGGAQNFEQLLEIYKCPDNLQQNSTTTMDEDASIFRKRKLVELVMTSAAPADTSPEAEPMGPPKQKAKAPKKRPRTITELATSAYRVPEPPGPAPLIADEPATIKESDATTVKGANKAKPRKRTSKASAAKKKKPAPPPPPVLLPPTEALQEVARQDFVFGTSSQLAVETSPTFLRDLHAAMRRSNQAEYIDLDTPVNSDGIEPPERKRLWAAGARDVDGDLFDVELSKMMEKSSPPLPARSDDDLFGYTGVDRKITLPNLSINVNEVETSLDGELLVEPVNGSPSKSVEATNFLIADDSIQLGSDISTGSPIPRRTKPAAESPAAKPQGSNSEVKQAETQAVKPSFELYTDARLSKEIASYGFKAVKSRQAKIALLEQCWQGRNHPVSPAARRTVTTSTAAGESASHSEVRTPRGRPRKNSGSTPEAQEPPPSAQPPVSPTKRRGRPRKDAAAASTAGKRTTASASRAKRTPSKSVADAPTAGKRKAPPAKMVVEIPDSASESDGSLSPIPSPSLECASSPLPVDLSVSVMDDTDPSLAIHPTEDQPLSHEYITKAVTSAPRTTDPANPSWHEKMLLYDPIVLEDLTTWLNCGQLTRVGFDGEVSTMEVKQWCESKSVCCLWKVNLRGKERKRL
ncbi:hypothetical protein BBK36DRAFT_1169704 [Trichoderma citrinoviride]|uniref:Structure-specific endonuclease subunit SLX4 n=1 Tax=Trichoderma citrinoviride TaxID=58853 RepID=A0A2T4B9X8_9HYPO|nr:hypothetical protein BBK36DRAFT_1169704 [Trichoderma citrinoviride]PTB66031.1 hypothetical protein BBK36DRAFT_1169704 [Trichoderma citrinoviride]